MPGKDRFWENQPEYEAEEAACLLCGYEPGTVRKGTAEYRRVLSLYRRLVAELPPCRDISNVKISHNWATGNHSASVIKGRKYYSRESIEAWAEKNGFHPDFLFPDQNLGADAEQEGIMFYRLLVAMAVDAYSYDPAADRQGQGVMKALQAALDRRGWPGKSDRIKAVIERAIKKTG
jgi:hypothetical protein